MTDNTQWIKNIEKPMLENNGADLYCLIKLMYKEHKMNFLQLIYDASQGIGSVISEGAEYVLDQDYDDPNDFKEVSFLIGDYENSTISPQNFVELMQIISDSYIEAHPNEKDSIEFYMNKLRERYSK
ncbi:hypothetical protein JMI89_11620 [Frischella sp. Ac48]|uniref:CDI immunity protein domain-containing protein n=1 Tax=Frischella japonica TaxID=2741544 RepID=A0ABR7R0W4_9GAMM|nr:MULTISPECIES: hypothetical protein [Frischella]MBC9131985.1 hypothetical protein [Frischella japonica]MBX4134273.1 hypothetical protein [Frischella sp. Ac48]